MRVYNQDKIVEVHCNKCKKQILVENEIVREGMFSVDYRWEYFSKKDGIKHSFDLCEACYDSFVAEFLIPVKKEDYTELL